MEEAKIVHCVGMFVGDAVEEPAGAGLHGTFAALAHGLPVPQLEPLLVLHNALLQIPLALPVLVQCLPGTSQPLRRHRLGLVFHIFHIALLFL